MVERVDSSCQQSVLECNQPGLDVSVGADTLLSGRGRYALSIDTRWIVSFCGLQ